MIKSKYKPVVFCVVLLLCAASVASASSSFPADSIRVKWMEGKKYILHKVEVKETWQHLSRRYNCTLDDLKAANEGVELLKVGQIINVPVITSNAATPDTDSKINQIPAPVQSRKPETGNLTAKDKTPVTYTVKKGETMYSISRRFNMSIQEIKSVNKLASDILSEGQVLIVGYQNAAAKPSVTETTAPVNAPSPKVEASPSVMPKSIQVSEQPVKENKPAVEIIRTDPVEKPAPKTAVVPSPAAGLEKPTKSVNPIKKGNTGKMLMQVTETGVATWIQDGQVNHDKYYALHRSAPIGTIVKLTNRMNNQFVYVKVVGALPDTGENENIIIKVSQAVSSKLNALDPLFQVELSYGLLQ